MAREKEIYLGFSERWRNIPKPTIAAVHGKVIAGVCAGLADRFGISPFVVRLAFVLSCVLPGPQFIAYLVMWVLMPKRPV